MSCLIFQILHEELFSFKSQFECTWHGLLNMPLHFLPAGGASSKLASEWTKSSLLCRRSSLLIGNEFMILFVTKTFVRDEMSAVTARGGGCQASNCVKGKWFIIASTPLHFYTTLNFANACKLPTGFYSQVIKYQGFCHAPRRPRRMHEISLRICGLL